MLSTVRLRDTGLVVTEPKTRWASRFARQPRSLNSHTNTWKRRAAQASKDFFADEDQHRNDPSGHSANYLGQINPNWSL